MIKKLIGIIVAVAVVVIIVVAAIRRETGWRRSAGPFLSDRPAPTHEKRRPLTGPPLHTYRSRLTEANP